MQDLPGHSLSEIGHMLLREVDGLVFGNAVGVFAGKHPAVAAVHLLWDLLTLLAQQRPAISVEFFPFLVKTFLF